MKESTRISIDGGTIIKALTIVAVFAGLFYISDLIVTLLVAVVLASAAEMPIGLLKKWGVSRGISVGILFLLLVLVIAALLLFFIPPLADDLAQFIQTLPKILDSIRIFGKDMGFKDLSMSMQQLSHDISKGEILTLVKTTLFGTSGFFATTTVVIGSVVNVVLTFVLAFYLALEERGVHKFLQIVVPKKHEAYVDDLWKRAQTKIGLWIQGQVLLSLFVSLLVYVPMLILSIPYATLLAVLAFFGELVPMVGLTFSVVPALFLAWVHGGTSLLGIVAVIYFIISQLESHVLYPKVMNKMVGVPAVVVILALVAGTKFAGLWGMILAVPLSAIIMELANDLEKRKANVE
jgi:predicted PurR-regulated permease PerM